MYISLLYDYNYFDKAAAVAGSLAAGGSAGSFVTASHAAWLVIAACGLWIIGSGRLRR